MNILLVTILVPVLLFLLPSTSHAIDMEFYTYGGFDAVVSAFQRVALIASDNNFKAIFFTTAAIGATAGFIGLMRKGIGWKNLLAFHTGVVIYFGLFVPTGNVWVYDTVLNRNQQVAGVPDLIVISAGGLNTVKRIIIDIINAAGDPIAFQQSAGGVGPKMLYEAATHNYSIKDVYMQQTFHDYINECVLFEMFRPASDININDVNSNTTDFMADLLAKANSPAIYTVVYAAANPQGTATTCSDAWSNYLQPYLSNANNFNEMIQGTCAAAGYDPNNAVEFTQCRATVLPAWIQQATGVALPADSLIRQTYIANRLMIALGEGDPTSQASSTFGSQAQGSFAFSDEWMPYMEAIMTAQALAFAPFLLLFLPTPIWKKVLAFVIGLLLYPTVWGIVDASLHKFAIDQSNKVYAAVAANKLGLSGLAFLTDSSAKILNMWWYTRASGMAIAGIITSLFVAFGHAAGQFVGHMERGAHAAGDQSGTKTFTPSGMAGDVNTHTGMTVPTLTNMARYGVGNMAASSTMDALSHTGGNLAVRDYFGGVVPSSDALASRNALTAGSSAMTAMKEMEAMGGYEKTVDMMSDSHARGETSKAIETAHLMAAAGGFKNLTNAEALAFASQAKESMDRVNHKYGTLATDLYGNDSYQNRLKAAEVHGNYLGAEDAGKAGAVLTSAVYDRIANQAGANQMSVAYYNELLKTKGSNPEGFKAAITGDKTGQLQAIDKFVTNGKENASMSDRADNFNATLNQSRTDLAHKMGRVHASGEYGNFHQDEQLVKAWGLQDNDKGFQELNEFRRTGLMTKGMAQAANAAYEFKPGKGPFQEGMKVEDYGVGEDGKLMINRATYQGKDGSITVANDQVSTSQAMDRGQLETYAKDQEGHGHVAQAFAAREIMSRLHGDESAIVQEQRNLKGGLISSHLMHGSDAELKSGGGESIRTTGGQVVKEGTVTDKNIAELIKTAKNAGFNELDGIKAGSQYQQEWGMDGNKAVLTGMRVKKEGESSYKDMAKKAIGKDERIGDSNVYGNNTVEYAPGGTHVQHATAEFGKMAAYEMLKSGSIPEWMLNNSATRNEIFTQAASDIGGMISQRVTRQGAIEGHMGIEGRAGLEVLGTGGGANAGGSGKAQLMRELTRNAIFTELSTIYEQNKDKGLPETRSRLSEFVGTLENKAQNHDLVTQMGKAMEGAEEKLNNFLNK